MGVRFPHLFSPLRIGKLTVRNRILSSGHDTVLVRDGEVTEELIAYHEARAKGGVGLIVLQVSGVHESSRYTTHVLMATDDYCVPGYARLAQAVHRHGAKVFGQLFHPGREILESKDGSAPVAWAPSATPTHASPRCVASERWSRSSSCTRSRESRMRRSPPASPLRPTLQASCS